jgi:hypothetical protein
VASQREVYPARVLCRVMRVAVSGFYAWRPRQAQPRPAEPAAAWARACFFEHRRRYGTRRLAAAWGLGRFRVRRLMREAVFHLVRIALTSKCFETHLLRVLLWGNKPSKILNCAKVKSVVYAIVKVKRLSHQLQTGSLKRGSPRPENRRPSVA